MQVQPRQQNNNRKKPVSITPKVLFGLIKDTFKEWQEDKASRLAAALAYYTAFSIAPLLIIAIAIAAFFFGEDAAQKDIVGQLQGLIGLQGAAAIQDMIANSRKPAEGTIATLISIALLIFGATGLFSELQDALNTIWEVAPKPNLGVKGVLRTRFISFGMVLGIGFLLLVSLVLSAGLAAVGNYFGHLLPNVVIISQLLNFTVSFAVITLLFGMMFKVLPDAKVVWGDVWIGAIITSLLFTIGKFLLGMYLGNGSVGSTYGAAGSFVVFLLWVNYSAQILFFGAEFTQVYANKYGSKIVPTENAVALTDKARVQQGIPRTKDIKAASQEDLSTTESNNPRLEKRQKSPHPALVLLSVMITGYNSLAQLVGVKKKRRNR